MVNPVEAFDRVWAAASKLKDLADKVKEADIRMAIADLLMNAADLKVKIADLTEENLKLKADLKERDKKRVENIVHKPPFFFREGETKPLCPKCWQGQKNDVYLTVHANGFCQCPVCTFVHSPDHFNAGRVESDWDPFKG